MEKKSVNLEIKEFDSESRILSGYASTFGFPADVQGDVIAKGAFLKSINKINTEGIPLLDSHKQDSEHVLGTVIDAHEDDHGLFIQARLADTPKVEEIRQKLKQGHINKMSIGFFIEQQHFTKQGNEEFRVIEKADLIEISVVPIPANSRATILSVKNKEYTDSQKCEFCNCQKEEKEAVVEQQNVVSEQQNVVEESQEDGVRVDETTENASTCQTPEGISPQEKEALENIAELLQQSLNQTRRKYDGK